MATERFAPVRRGRLAAALSAVIPGLGQLACGQPGRCLMIIAVTALLLTGSWAIAESAGASAGIFCVMMIVLPWWSIQAYDAFLCVDAFIAREGRALGFGCTLRAIWQQAHDIRYLGALFLLTAFTDLYIIVKNPEYALTIFCLKPSGTLGVLVKAQSPTLHTLIGYGFLRLRRWSLFLYLAYAAFGLLNATVNYACFGYGRVRTVFVISLLAFTGYVIWRRDRFQPRPEARRAL
jgi:hypothetical protein